MNVFNDELITLCSVELLPKISKLRSVNHFRDSAQLIRVGDRIADTESPPENKHQRIGTSCKTSINWSRHIKWTLSTFHAGIQVMLTSLHQSFWFINGRTIRNVLRKYLVNCVKPLILERTFLETGCRQTVLFYVSSVDLARPFSIKNGKLRNRTIIMAYVCLMFFL